MKKLLLYLRALSSLLRRSVIEDGLMRKLLNLFPFILPFCLIALIGGSSASAAVPTSTLAQQPPPCMLFGDFSGNGEIDVVDIQQVASRWRCKCGDGCYDSRYDIDNDCDIDVVDIMRIAARWAYTCDDPPPPIEVCGSISEDTTWTTGNVYLVTCDLTVNSGVTLTVQHGVVVKFNSGRRLTVDGSLLAQGTDDYGVVFTSWKDDSYAGDTNNDGSATTPAPRDWEAIYVESGGIAQFDHAVVMYGGYGGPTWGDWYGSVGGIENRDGSLTVTNSFIAHNGYSGIYASGTNASLSVSHSTITGNTESVGYGGYGISVRSGASASITNNSISNNARFGIHIVGGSPIISSNSITGNGDLGLYGHEVVSPIIANNSFNDNAGYALKLYFLEGNLNGNGGNTFSGNASDAFWLRGSLAADSVPVPYSTIPYVVDSSLTVKSGVTLTLQAGTIIKFSDSQSNLIVQGTLLAQGTPDNEVVFTSIKDDSYGGDTNNDGSATSPAPRDWEAIYVESGGIAQFDHAVVMYGGNGGPGVWPYSDPWGSRGGIDNRGGSVAVTNSLIAYNDYSGIYASGSGSDLSVSNCTIRDNTNSWAAGNGIHYSNSSGSPIIEANTIFNNAGHGIYISAASPTISSNSIADNGNYGVYNGNTSTLVSAENNWWGHESGPAPYGSGNGINYHSVYSPTLGVWVIDKFYVDADPWLGKDYWIEHHYGTDVPWNNYEAEPVNTATGNYTYQHTDLSIPTRGQPLEFTRSYNSRAPQDGPLGFGWTHNYNVSATENITDSTVLITYGDGRQDKFTWDGAAYVPNPGTFSELTKVGNAFILRLKDQTVYNFDASGKLASIVDRNGNTITPGYTGDLLTSVTGPAGRVLLFTYNADGRLTQAQDPAGRTIAFSYDGDGNLSTVTDVMGFNTTYTYDADHRLLTATDANGHVFVTNVYDSAGRVIEQYDALGNKTTFAYDEVNHKTLVTDPRGNTTTYQYDDRYRLLSEKDPLNFTISYTYDDQNNRTSVTDKQGNTTYYAYDERGNTTVITDTMGYTTTMTYDAQNNLTSVTDARGYTTNYTYDANGNLISVTDPLGNTTTFAYDGFGQMTLTTDPNGNTMQYQYDAYGHQIAVIDALGNATTFTYDIVGRKLSETDPLGRTTTYTYDTANRLLTVTDPLGGVTSYTYDAVGNRIAMQDALGRVTQYGYDAKDRLVVITDTLGNTTTYTYDANDNRTSVTDANGNTTTFTYDALNRLASMQDALGNTTTYQYDANGNRVQVTDAKGQVTTYTYDALNRLTGVTYADGYTVTYTYDAVGNRLTMTDPTGTTEYAYDALNRPTVITDTTGLALRYTYDAAGNRATLTYPDGQVITYTYDAMNRLIGVTEPFDPARQVAYTYDVAGQLSQVAYPNGITGAYAYDALGRLTAITYTHAISGTLAFFQYTLDAVGNRTQTVDADGTTSYTYDNLDRLTGVIYPDGEQVTYTYDAAGNRTAMTSTVSGAIAYTYDAANRLLTAGPTAFTWDANGNTLSKGSTAYTYDAANRLTQVVSGTTTVQYAYNGDGKRVQRKQHHPIPVGHQQPAGGGAGGSDRRGNHQLPLRRRPAGPVRCKRESDLPPDRRPGERPAAGGRQRERRRQ